jgi:hypothetical protein
MSEAITPVVKVQTPFKRLCSQFAESPVAMVGHVHCALCALDLTPKPL